MRKVLSVLLTLVVSAPSFGAEVWITTPRVVAREKLEEMTAPFRSRIKDADFVLPFDSLLSHPVSEAEMAVILDLDSMARAASLNGSFQKAFEYYSRLSMKLSPLPNVSGLEKIVLSTRINLAHMATMLKLQKASHLWLEAHAWSPEAILSPEEFSPAVILRFSRPQFPIKRQRVQIQTSEHTALYVDGQRMKAPYVVFLEPGHHQASVLAPSLNWGISNFVVTDKAMTFTVRPTPFVTGTCENPQISKSERPEKVRLLALYREDCARVYSKRSWYNIEGEPVALPDKPTQVELSNNLKPGSSQEGQKLQGETKGFISKVGSSGWFWAGVGAVVLGALIISHNQVTTVPTHTMQ